MRPLADPIGRFWSRVDRSGGSDACWPWTGQTTKSGYGTFGYKSSDGLWHSMIATRFMLWLLRGRVDADLDVDHRCHDVRACTSGDKCPHRRCVNPRHLETVTRLENIRRAYANLNAANANRRKTHCSHGHPLSGENLRPRTRGGRVCVTCERAAAVRYRARLRQAATT